jgi:hypothetical protein
MQRLGRPTNLRIDLGTVTFGPKGELGIVSAKPNFADYLNNIVTTVNGKKELSIKVPPPQGAEPLSVYFLVVGRTASDLLDMMRQYLEQTYDILLEDVVAVTPPKPQSPAAPGPLQLLHDAVDREDSSAVQQHLLSLGVDEKVCEAIVAAWQNICTPGSPMRERLARMQQLSGAIGQVKGSAKVQQELWRLQKSLTRYT